MYCHFSRIASGIQSTSEQYWTISPVYLWSRKKWLTPLLGWFTLSKEDDSRISTSVYTDYYLHFSSHHPQPQKELLVRTLFSWAVSLSSSSSVKFTEGVHMSEAHGSSSTIITVNLQTHNTTISYCFSSVYTKAIKEYLENSPTTWHQDNI